MKHTAMWLLAVALWSAPALADERSDARACLQVANPDIAVPACNRLLASGKGKRNVILNNLGVALNQAQKYDLAIAAFDESIQLDPSLDAPWSNRALSWYRKGELDKAASDIDRSLQINPLNAAAYNVRGEITSDLHDYDGCLRAFDMYVMLLPKEATAYNNRGSCHRYRGEYDLALKDLNQAIRLRPGISSMLSSRGELFRLTGDLDRAIQEQSKAIQLDPKEAYNYIRRGDSYRYKGSLDLALADYAKALALDPDSPVIALTGRGLTLEKNGDVAGAKAAFEQATTASSVERSDENRSALETAQARLAALNSGIAQPEIPAAPSRASSQTSIPTPQAKIPAAVAVHRPTGKRVALVFGNSAYRKVPELTNPQHDADAVARSLRATGFDSVTLEQDDTREKMIAALRKFANEADGADWAVVYYAGHGIEIGGVNYLIPVDAELHTDRDVQFETIAFDQIMAAIDGAKKLKLVLLDACRDNPFEPQMRKTAAPEAVAAAATAGAKVNSRSVGRGLAEVKVAGATLVVFAAKQGEVALDGEGGNSPFAVAVTQRIATPHVEINKVFRLVRDDVMEATAGRQEPYTYGSLPGKEDFFFVDKE